MTLGANTGSSSGNGRGSGGFDTLASTTLPSFGSAMQPSWKRSLPELAAANQALNSNTYSQAMGPPTAAAEVLLGSRTDFGSLASSASAVKTSKGSAGGGIGGDGDRSASALPLEGGIEEAARRRRDEILEGVLKRENEQTQKLLDRAVQRQLENDRKAERDFWRKELVGDRNLVNSTNNMSLQLRADIQFGGKGSTQNLLVPDYETPSAGVSVSVDQRSVDAIVEGHLEVVIKKIQQEENPDFSQVVHAFQKVASSSNTAVGYQVAWKLVGCMGNGGNPVNRALGAMVHLCRMYQTIVSNEVRTSNLARQDVSTPIQYVNSMAGTIAAYVKLQSGSAASVWEILYCCEYQQELCYLAGLLIEF